MIEEHTFAAYTLCRILEHCCIVIPINASFYLTFHFTTSPPNPNLDRKVTDQMYSTDITKLGNILR
jgi:hypothetical protein